MKKFEFLATRNTGPNYQTYNNIVAALVAAGIRAQGYAFGDLIKRYNPKLYSQVFSSTCREDGRKLSLNKVFQHLFQNPRCICCGGPLLGKCNFYCSKPCSMFHRTGFDNPSKNPVVQAKKVDTSLMNHGTEYPMQNSSIVAKAIAVLRSRTPAQRKATREKIISTNLSRYGVMWTTQNSEVLTKVHRSCFSIKTMRYRGRTYEYQGWEDKVITKLADKFGAKDILTQYHTDFPSKAVAKTGTRPDLYVQSLNTLVEVKSLYTFNGSKAVLNRNRNKAKRLEANGVLCRWVVVVRRTRSNGGTFDTKTLPLGWHGLSTRELTEILK